MLFSWFTEIDPKATRIVGFNALSYYSNVPTICCRRVPSSYDSRGDMYYLRSIFAFTHIWVVTIYAANVVADVLVCVGVYVAMLTHILTWSYALFVYGNPTSL